VSEPSFRVTTKLSDERNGDAIVSIEPGTPRWPADFARRIGDELVEALTPRCEQVSIAGSLRRGKTEVSDIEIPYVPRIGLVHSPGELFTKSGSLPDELIERWLTKGVLTKRANKNGIPTWALSTNSPSIPHRA
jgi:hypothetical protein